MPPAISIRPIERNDYAQWRPHWDGYNTFCAMAASLFVRDPNFATHQATLQGADALPRRIQQPGGLQRRQHRAVTPRPARRRMGLFRLS